MDQIAWICGWCSGCFDNRRVFTLGFVLFGLDRGVAAAIAGYLGLGLGGQFLAFAMCPLLLRDVANYIRKISAARRGHTMKSGSIRCRQIGTVTGASKVLSTRAQ